MLTIAETVKYHTGAARTKADLARRPGVYLVRMLAGSYTAKRRMVLLGN